MSGALAQTPTAATSSSQPFIYPSKGQTQDKQKKDTTECNGWSTNQTGFHPVKTLVQQNAAAAQAQQQTQQAQTAAAQQVNANQGAAVEGPVKGAAGGAVIGAIAGDARKGAAIG